MNKTSKPLLWLIAMLAATGIASLVLRGLAAQAHAYADPSAHLDLSVLLRMPIPVTDKVDNGWNILLVIWTWLALVAYCGKRYARAISNEAGPILVGLIVLSAAMASLPILLSSDAYAYVIYGRLYGLHGVNPYFLPLPLGEHLDPIISKCLTIYGNPPPGDNYGPLWTLLAGLLSKVTAPTSLAFQVIVQRVVAIAFATGAVAGLYRLLRRRECESLGIARYAFHPLLLFETAVGAHNDIMMVALALWAFVVADEMPLIAGLLIGASIATKYVSACALPFLVVRAARNGWKGAFGLVIVAAVVVMLALEPFWIGRLTLLSLIWQSANISMSPSWIASLIVDAVAHRLGGNPVAGSHDRLIQAGFALAFCLIYGIALWRYARNLEAAHLWLVVAALLWLAPMLNPWYALWLLPASAANGHAARYAWWFGVFALLRYAGEVPIYPPIWVLAGVTIAIFGGPLLVARITRPRSTGQPLPA